jgi:hypothetical protein
MYQNWIEIESNCAETTEERQCRFGMAGSAGVWVAQQCRADGGGNAGLESAREGAARCWWFLREVWQGSGGVSVNWSRWVRGQRQRVRAGQW